MGLSLYNIYKDLILEAVSPDEVSRAIEEKRRVNIFYDPPDSDAKGKRTIDPYVYGLTLAGNPAIRAFQSFGDTATERPLWKLFLLDRITRWEPTDYIIRKPISDIDPTIPAYNEEDDKMSVIYKTIKFK